MALPDAIKKIANIVRTAVFGSEVRESIAKSIEITGETAQSAVDKSLETETKQDILNKKYNEQIAEATDITEIKDFHVSGVTGEIFDTMGIRADNFDRNFIDVKRHLDWAKSKLDNQRVDLKLDFGAVGDGIADDSDALQNALDTIRHETGSKVTLYIPAGTYRFTRLMNIHRVKIIADNNAIFLHDGPDAYFEAKPLYPETVNEFYELIIWGLGFRGTNGAQYCFKLKRASQFYFFMTYMYDFTEVAVDLDDCTIGNFVRPTVSNNKVAFRLSNVAGVSWDKGNVFANTKADMQFKNYNNGIGWIDMWSEDSAASFLFDNADSPSVVGGIHVDNTTIGRNDPPGGPIVKVIGNNKDNFIGVQNMVMKLKLASFNLANLQNFVDIDLTNARSDSYVNIKVHDSELQNTMYPDAYFARSVGNTVDQVRIVFEDNATSGKVNILEGEGRVIGLDRSGAFLTPYTRVRGELVLEHPKNSIGIERAFGWSDTYKNPRYHDGTQYRNIQGIHTGSTANRPANPPPGFQYTDFTLNKPIWYDGVVWRDAMGTRV